MNAQINPHLPTHTKHALQLQLQGVDVQFGNHLALQHIDLKVYAGERVAFVGANGSGKSTLGNVIAGRSGYEVTGSVQYNEQDLLSLAPELRAQAGLFLAFQ